MGCFDPIPGASQMMRLKSLKVLVKGELAGFSTPPKVAGTLVSDQMLKEALHGSEGLLNIVLRKSEGGEGASGSPCQHVNTRACGLITKGVPNGPGRSAVLEPVLDFCCCCCCLLYSPPSYHEGLVEEIRWSTSQRYLVKGAAAVVTIHNCSCI